MFGRVQRPAANFCPLTKWANAFVVTRDYEDNAEKVCVAGHVTDILPLTNIAIPPHLQHGSLPVTKWEGDGHGAKARK